MGNCQKREEALTVTNFDEDKWGVISTHINPNCFLLKNYSHPHVRLFKWIATSNSSRKVSQWREEYKPSYCVSIYESGETGKYTSEFSIDESNKNWQKKPYIITEELIRLKDLSLTEDEAVIISEQSLSGFQEMIAGLGGFVARENMIYLNREGLVKIWVNENLANNQMEFEHPNIKESEFICSILHQIFTRCTSLNGFDTFPFYEHLKTGEITFSEVLTKLNSYIIQRNLSKEVIVEKEIFDKVIDGYELKSKAAHSFFNKPQHQGKGFKFLVADDNIDNPDTFVKDYSKTDRNQMERVNSRSDIFVKGQNQLMVNRINDTGVNNNAIWHNVVAVEFFSG